MGVEKNLGEVNVNAFNSCWKIFEIMTMNDSKEEQRFHWVSEAKFRVFVPYNVLSYVIFSMLASGYNNGSPHSGVRGS